MSKPDTGMPGHEHESAVTPCLLTGEQAAKLIVAVALIGDILTEIRDDLARIDRNIR